MKKLLLSLMVIATLASCGKDNKVASTAATTTTSSNPAVTIADQAGVALGQKIDAYTTNFGTQVVQAGYQYLTYQQILNYGISLNYLYTNSTTSSGSGAGSNCELKWKIVYVCKYTNSSSSVSGVSPSRTVSNGSVDINVKIAELKSIINSSHPLYPIQTNGTSYLIRSTNGKQYIFDTRYPLQANPIGTMEISTGATEYLYNITE